MTPMIWAIAAAMGCALFVLGWLGGHLWRRAGEDPQTHLRRANLFISLFFTVIALLVSVNMIALVYRHNRQVECDANLIRGIAIRNSALMHVHSDAVIFDGAMLSLLDDIDTGAPLPAAERQRVLDALHQLIEARQSALSVERENPLPTC